MFIWYKNDKMKLITRSPLFIFLLINMISSNDYDSPKVEIINFDSEVYENYDDNPDSANASPKKNQLVPPYVLQQPEYKRVCIYPNWSILRDSNMAKIFPEDIPADLCTHIHYAYANIDVKTLELVPSQFQDINSGDHGGPIYERINRLRDANPNLKILISIGGWFAKSTPFNQILISDATRARFIQNVLHFLKKWNFDGLDIQWEYPGDVEYGATTDSKIRFTYLIKYLYKAFKDEYKQSFKKYILTAFAPADEDRIDAGYQVRIICKYLDYISIATYDYTGPYDSKTGYNSPLYSRNSMSNSVNSSINIWLERGCPSKKLLLGIPTYARVFKIIRRTNSNLLFVGIESEPYVSPSVYTSEEGILSYYEVCELMRNKESRVYWDDIAEVPFAIVSNSGSTDYDSSSNLWISYEDARSARKKVEYVKKMSLGGVSVWSLDMDDFKDLFCNLGTFPIIESVKEEFEHKITLITDDLQKAQPTVAMSTEFVSTKFVDGRIFENYDSDNEYYESDNTKISNGDNKSINRLPEKISFDTSNESIANHVHDNYEILKKKLEKFKAIREIKLVACLDKRKCSLNSSNHIVLNYIFFNIFIFKIISNLLVQI